MAVDLLLVQPTRQPLPGPSQAPRPPLPARPSGVRPSALRWGPPPCSGPRASSLVSPCSGHRPALSIFRSLGPASAHIPGHHPSPTLTTLGANTALACAAAGGCPPSWVLNWTPQRADLGVTVEPAGLSASLLAGPSEQWHQPQQRGDAWSLAMSANTHTHTLCRPSARRGLTPQTGRERVRLSEVC